MYKSSCYDLSFKQLKSDFKWAKQLIFPILCTKKKKEIKSKFDEINNKNKNKNNKINKDIDYNLIGFL